MAKGYEVKVLNLNEVISDFEALKDIDMASTLRQAGVLVADEAKRRAPKKTGALTNSIRYELEGNDSVVIGTNLMYAPYVEYGTGKFARNGNGRPGYWVFVKGSDGNIRQKDRKIYTREEAIKIYWSLVNSGIPEDRVWITQGQQAQPFLEPALDAMRGEIADLFAAQVKDATGEDK